MQLISVRLSEISRSERIDPRRDARKSNIASLKASISADGILQPPILRRATEGDARYEVVAGNRRVRAISELASEGAPIAGIEIEADPEFKAFFYEDENDAHARTVALTENIVREQLHPIDEYQAFAQLVDDGLTIEDIALRFALKPAQVRQRMALGSLAPEIRDAWRAGRIDNDTAKAFTLIASQTAQKKLFDKLSKRGSLYGQTVRAEAGVDYDAANAVRVIGLEAYRAAGGKVSEDLFGHFHAIKNPALAKRLLAEAVDAKCEQLVADGWSFALPKASVKNAYEWPTMRPKIVLTDEETKRRAEAQATLSRFRERNHDALTPDERAQVDQAEETMVEIETASTLRAFTPKLRKRSGCFVYVDTDELRIYYGVQKPAEKPKPSKKPAKAAPEADSAGPDEASAPEPAKISNAVLAELSALRTGIAAAAVERSPRLAIALAVAALGANGAFSPARLQARGMSGLGGEEEDAPEFIEGLAGALELADGVPEDHPLLQRLAAHVARSLDLRVYNADATTRENDALVAAIAPDTWRAIALERFSPQEFFSRVSTAVTREAFLEMSDAGAKAPSKKPDLIAAAVSRARDTGWLPPLLRHPGATKDDAQ